MTVVGVAGVRRWETASGRREALRYAGAVLGEIPAAERGYDGSRGVGMTEVGAGMTEVVVRERRGRR